MATSREIRLKNFIELSSGFKRIGEFCEKVEINPAYFSQITNRSKALGDELARRIERNLGLPIGYMDHTHGDEAHEASQQIPADTIGLAYTINGLPEAIRHHLRGLIYSIAAEQHQKETTSQTPRKSGGDIPAFNIQVNVDEDHTTQDSGDREHGNRADDRRKRDRRDPGDNA